MRRKNENIRAYFTVEAACVLPLVLGIQMLLIYALFFQYDRCLNEQDVMLTAFTRDHLPQGRESSRLIAWEDEGITYSRQLGKIYAKGGGVLRFPITLGTDDDVFWQSYYQEEMYDLDPVSWLWWCRSLKEEFVAEE